jgi:hypothetical protein
MGIAVIVMFWCFVGSLSLERVPIPGNTSLGHERQCGLANQFIYGCCVRTGCQCVNFEGIDANTYECLCGHFKNFHVKYVLSQGTLIQIPTSATAAPGVQLLNSDDSSGEESTAIAAFVQRAQVGENTNSGLSHRNPRQFPLVTKQPDWIISPGSMGAMTPTLTAGSKVYVPASSANSAGDLAISTRRLGQPPMPVLPLANNTVTAAITTRSDNSTSPATDAGGGDTGRWSTSTVGSSNSNSTASDASLTASWVSPFSENTSSLFAGPISSILSQSQDENADQEVPQDGKMDSYISSSSSFFETRMMQHNDPHLDQGFPGASESFEMVADQSHFLGSSLLFGLPNVWGGEWSAYDSGFSSDVKFPHTGALDTTQQQDKAESMDDDSDMSDSERLEYLNNTAAMLYAFVHQVFVTTGKFFRFDRDMKKFYEEFGDSKRMVTYCGGIYVILATFPFCFQRIEDRSHHSVIIMLRTLGDSFRGISEDNKFLSSFIGRLAINKSDVGLFTESQLSRGRCLLEDLDSRNIKDIKNQQQQQQGQYGYHQQNSKSGQILQISDLRFSDVVNAAKALKGFITSSYSAQSLIMPLGKDTMSFYNNCPTAMATVKAIGGISKLCALFPSVFSVFQCLHSKAMFARLIQQPTEGKTTLASHGISAYYVTPCSQLAASAGVSTPSSFVCEVSIPEIMTEFSLLQTIADGELVSTLAALAQFMIMTCGNVARPMIRLDKQVAEFYNYFPKSKLVLKMVGGLLGLCERYPTMFTLEEMGGIKVLRLVRSRDILFHDTNNSRLSNSTTNAQGSNSRGLSLGLHAGRPSTNGMLAATVSKASKSVRDVAVALHAYVRQHGQDGGRKLRDRDLMQFYTTSLAASLNAKMVIEKECGGIASLCEKAPDLFRKPIELAGKGLLILARTTTPAALHGVNGTGGGGLASSTGNFGTVNNMSHSNMTMFDGGMTPTSMNAAVPGNMHMAPSLMVPNVFSQSYNYDVAFNMNITGGMGGMSL